MCVADNTVQLAVVCLHAEGAAGPHRFGLPEARHLAIKHGYVFDGVPVGASDAKRADLSGRTPQPSSIAVPRSAKGIAQAWSHCRWIRNAYCMICSVV